MTDHKTKIDEHTRSLRNILFDNTVDYLQKHLLSKDVGFFEAADIILGAQASLIVSSINSINCKSDNEDYVNKIHSFKKETKDGIINFLKSLGFDIIDMGTENPK